MARYVLGTLRVVSLVAGAAALSALAGCKGTTVGNQDGSAATVDHGAGASDLMVAGNADGGTTAMPDLTQAASPDLVMTGPEATKLTPGNLYIEGITDDEHVIGTDEDTYAVTAYPLAGGAGEPIAQNADYVLVAGDVVLVWHDSDTNSGAGILTVWTPTGGAHDIAQSSLIQLADTDGDYVVYGDNANLDGTTTEIWVAKTDGTGQKRGLGDQTNDNACSPFFGFGPGAALVVSCPAAGAGGPDGGATDGGAADGGADAGVPLGGNQTSILSTIDLTNGLSTTIKTNVVGWTTDPDDKYLLTLSDSGEADLMPYGGSGSVTIDTNVMDAVFIENGAAIAYVTGDGALKRTPVVSPTSTTLVSDVVTDFQGFTSDDKFAVMGARLGLDMDTGDGLVLASLSSPGTPTTLATGAAAAGDGWGDAFTDDDSRVIYFTAINANFVGTLNSQPVAGGAAATHGVSVWQALAVGGTTVVFNDNYKSMPSSSDVADIRVVDTASQAAPTLIAQKAKVSFVLNGNRDKVIYSVPGSANQAGIFVADLP